ncbi:MAG: BatA and WFA domain-containing protein [Acidobacteriota bacterium]|nr:BatA and WFA domain-containing protein [Acidobacteriota bacterium]
MFFANLGVPQFLALFGAVSAISIALYLLDRSRRRVIVSTLRFWTAAEQPTAVSRKKHIQQPFSLLLQLLAMLLLLLAISQLRVGSEAGAVKHHVLVLETSAWMNARAANGNGRQTLMDIARNRARAYLRALPAGDLVMLVRADALSTPATPFESNRRKLETAIAESEPSATSLNLSQAFTVARKAQENARSSGEVVFIGSGRISESDTPASVPNLRILPVADAANNIGLRKIGLRRSAADPELWDIFVSARNYGPQPQQAAISAAVANSPAGAVRILLPANSEREATFTYRTRAAAVLQVRLLPNDSFPDDNRASVELPAEQPLNVTVYSNQPELLRPILAANRQIAAVYKPVAQYTPIGKGLVILDRFRPATRPEAPSVWIDPPAVNSPIPIRTRVQNPPQIRWITDNPLGAGLRTRDIHLASSSVFNTAPGDLKVAETDQGPLIVARPANPKMVVLGFHPALSAMRYELATPLLFANIFRWIAPDIFLERRLNTQPVGTVNVTLQPGADPAAIRVQRPDGSPLPFSVQGQSLHFFSGTPGVVRVISGGQESVYSLSLPEVGDTKWIAPETAKRGVPNFRDVAKSHDIWQVLAILAAAILIFEWIRWGELSARVAGPRLATQKKAA